MGSLACAVSLCQTAQGACVALMVLLSQQLTALTGREGMAHQYPCATDQEMKGEVTGNLWHSREQSRAL